MTIVVAAVYAAQQIPVRLVGSVSASKNGTVSIDYKEPGMVKATNKVFLSSEVLAYMEGDAGFVVAMMNDPVTKMVGEMTIKDDKVILESEAGRIVVNKVNGASVTYTEVAEDSKEAKAAARAAKVKGVKIKKEKKGKKSKKDKSEKGDKSEKKSKKKKKKNKDKD